MSTFMLVPEPELGIAEAARYRQTHFAYTLTQMERLAAVTRRFHGLDTTGNAALPCLLSPRRAIVVHCPGHHSNQATPQIRYPGYVAYGPSETKPPPPDGRVGPPYSRAYSPGCSSITWKAVSSLAGLRKSEPGSSSDGKQRAKEAKVKVKE